MLVGSAACVKVVKDEEAAALTEFGEGVEVDVRAGLGAGVGEDVEDEVVRSCLSPQSDSYENLMYWDSSGLHLGRHSSPLSGKPRSSSDWQKQLRYMALFVTGALGGEQLLAASTRILQISPQSMNPPCRGKA